MHVARGPWTSSRKVSVGPRGAWVMTPSQLHGWVPLSAFGIRAATARATSVQPKLLVPASRMPVRTVGTAGPNPTCPLCETNVRTICTGKYESEEFAGRVSRAGGTPVVVAGVRSPFGYYVSHYFYALHAQQQHRDPPHRRLGAAWFSSKHAVCLQKKPKRAA